MERLLVAILFLLHLPSSDRVAFSTPQVYQHLTASSIGRFAAAAAYVSHDTIAYDIRSTNSLLSLNFRHSTKGVDKEIFQLIFIKSRSCCWLLSYAYIATCLRELQGNTRWVFVRWQSNNNVADRPRKLNMVVTR